MHFVDDKALTGGSLLIKGLLSEEIQHMYLYQIWENIFLKKYVKVSSLIPRKSIQH